MNKKELRRDAHSREKAVAASDRARREISANAEIFISCILQGSCL